MAIERLYCNECDSVTDHDNGHCRECRDDELHAEAIALSRTKRKCLMIITAVSCLIGINWAMANHYSGDDVARTAMSAIVTGIATWFSTSKVQEDKA